MFDINPGLILWTIITFILVVFVLSKVAWKPLVKSLQDREDGIRDALHKAETARKEAEQILAQNKDALARANEETARVLREGRELTERMKSEILAKANDTAKTMVAQAKEEIQREKEAAVVQLRNEVADLAISAAEKIIDESLDIPKQKKYVDKVLQQMTKN